MALRPLSDAELQNIMVVRGITYHPPAAVAAMAAIPGAANVVQTSMSRVFPIPRAQLYALLADIDAHSRLFANIQSSSIAPKALFPSVGADEEVALEHVTEAGPMLALVRYKFTPGTEIAKEIITNPFADVGYDRKRGTVRFVLADDPAGGTLLGVESNFNTPAGPTPFVRGLVDHVWVDFFENLMVQAGEIAAANKLAGPNA